MGLYVKRFGRVGYALGPSEERGFALWVGYDIAGMSDDLSHLGLTRVDHWTSDQIADLGIITFSRIEPTDGGAYEKLGIERKPC